MLTGDADARKRSIFSHTDSIVQYHYTHYHGNKSITGYVSSLCYICPCLYNEEAEESRK